MIDRLALRGVARTGQIDPETREKFIRTSAGFLGLLSRDAPRGAPAPQNGTALSPFRHTVSLHCEDIFTEEINSEQNTSTP
jgi:hypothetical protein